jgi:hypothetical protein
MNTLLDNINRIYTTELGRQRIQRNLELKNIDLVNWCKYSVKKSDNIIKKGKNWYVYKDNCIITINASSYTVITAHKNRNY